MPLLLKDILSALNNLSDEDSIKLRGLRDKFSPHFVSISNNLYEKLDDTDRANFITWFIKRWANIDLVPSETMAAYKKLIFEVSNQSCDIVTINDKPYKIIDLAPQGYRFKLAAYKWNLLIHDVYYNQYEHKLFKVTPGDVIIDAGGFIGDTAALFCYKTAGNCEIHSFEVLQENIDLFYYNNKINNIEDKVTVNRIALTEKTGETIGVVEKAIQGATSVSSNCLTEQRIQTVTIDDYVISANLKRVDFIKMDIEGSEIPALIGALDTIKKYRPKLALCLYHKWDDVITIPALIESLGIDYLLNFKWVELINGWEAVLLARPACTEHINPPIS